MAKEYIEKEAAKKEIARWTGYIDEDMILRIQIGLCRLPAANVRENVIRTQADKLRAMGDEELATWLNCMQSNAYHHGRYQSDIKPYPNTNKGWLDWLKSPVEEVK